MADAPPDAYAAARAALREIAKWEMGLLAALGAALSAGITLAALPKLEGLRLAFGGLLGLVVIACILAAITSVRSILVPRLFPVKRLEEAQIRRALEPYLSEILPGPDVKTVDALLAKLKDPKLNEVERADYRAQKAKLGSCAALLELERRAKASRARVTNLFCGAILCLLGLSFLLATPKEAADARLRFDPGPAWGGLTQALARACPADDPLVAQGAPHPDLEGWWQLRIAAPSVCAGAVFSLPGAVVLPDPAPPRARRAARPSARNNHLKT